MTGVHPDRDFSGYREHPLVVRWPDGPHVLNIAKVWLEQGL